MAVYLEERKKYDVKNVAELHIFYFVGVKLYIGLKKTDFIKNTSILIITTDTLLKNIYFKTTFNFVILHMQFHQGGSSFISFDETICEEGLSVSSTYTLSYRFKVCLIDCNVAFKSTSSATSSETFISKSEKIYHLLYCC